MTLKEFEHTLRIVHDVCQTVTKVPEENIQQVRNGNYIDDELTKVSELVFNQIKKCHWLKLTFFEILVFRSLLIGNVAFNRWNGGSISCCRKAHRLYYSNWTVWNNDQGIWTLWIHKYTIDSNFPLNSFVLHSQIFWNSWFCLIWITANDLTNNCEAGYTMLKCFRENNNEFWIPWFLAENPQSIKN